MIELVQFLHVYTLLTLLCDFIIYSLRISVHTSIVCTVLYPYGHTVDYMIYS